MLAILYKRSIKTQVGYNIIQKFVPDSGIIGKLVTQFSMNTQYYLQEALALAMLRRGFCAPNPSVGCVIANNNRLVGRGNHIAQGEPHAEVAALKDAGSAANGATVYVTLEPCSHHGLTPPCTDALIDAGVKKVVYAFADPNSTASGGATILQAAGIHVEHAPLNEIDTFYAPYRHWLQTRQCTLTAKIALSLDGKFAYQSDQPRAMITGFELEQFTMQQRLQHDAIVTSVKTIVSDNPQLNVRFIDGSIGKVVAVLDSQATCPLDARFIKLAKSAYVLHAETAEDKSVQRLEAAGVKCISLPTGKNNQLDPEAINLALGEQGLHTAWVETGATWLNSLLAANYLDKLYVYYGKTILGAHGREAFINDKWLANVKTINWTPYGDEIVGEIIL